MEDMATKGDLANCHQETVGNSEDVGDFYSTDVQREAGMEHVSNRTVRRALNKMPAYGYKFIQCRKKGQLVKPDLTKRLRWAPAGPIKPIPDETQEQRAHEHGNVQRRVSLCTVQQKAKKVLVVRLQSSWLPLPMDEA